ncbi:MAG TPA: glycoside hydrolase family 57 protein [Candidatus Limnocylindrales bacterium]|nr:glycoside hydrolase family 57 protein [Candidatus Limnocylindrales bacterium]
MKGRLPVAIIWHMHQPYYKHPQTGEFALPWVRLHASKDYVHMAKLLREFPGVKANFTVVPSLREQLEDYARGAEDEDTRVTMRTVEADLTDEEKRHVLRRFFSIHHGNVISRNPDYRRLLELAMAAGDRFDLLSDAYFVDLVTWFNLAWIDPDDIAADERLAELREKGAGFTRDDVRYVVGRQRLMASGVTHLYQRLERDGQIELLTVPYYHPILPLLIDNRAALRSDPDAVMPAEPFAYPEDAAYQLEQAIVSHERTFGARPKGVWPSEGSVSPEAADAIAAAGLEWLASDEGVLARSLGVEMQRDEIGALLEPQLLYRPYRLPSGATAIFRDREISDRIGFTYGSMTSHDAVGDLIWKLERARDRLPDDGGPWLASIILDGENAWEAYPNNGNDFLRRLYGTFEADPRFETVRVSDHLAAHPAREELAELHSGSWIDANYRVWIGEPAHAAAWSALSRTRAFAKRQWGGLAQMPPQVRQALMVAEGSDWFWWYSSRNSSPEDLVFDELFRANLQVVWWLAGEEPPEELRAPFADPGRLGPVPVRGGAMLPGTRDA